MIYVILTPVYVETAVIKDQRGIIVIDVILTPVYVQTVVKLD